MNKIIFYIGQLTQGGAERVITNLANYFCKQGMNVILVTSVQGPSKYYLHKSIKQIALDSKLEPNKVKRNINRIKTLRYILKKEEPDLSLSFLAESNFRMVIASRLLNVPIVVSVRNDPRWEYHSLHYKFMAKFLYSFCEGIVFQTENAKSFFPKRIQKRAQVIPNPINDEFLKSPYKGERNKTIVSVGRLEPQKNHELLIDAFHDILDDFPDYNLIIYGDGSLRSRLEEKTYRMGLQDKVFMPGTQNYIRELIYESSLFVLTSNYEGMPNALMEAMALGLPVISTDCPCGGPAYLIKHGFNGLLVETNNKEQLVNAIRSILSNKELSNRLGRNASKIQEELNPDTIYKRWNNFFTSILNQK